MYSENAVCCNKCHRWAHQACAGFNQTEFKLLTKKGKNQENLMWFCDACTPLIRCFLQGKPQSPLHSPKSQDDLNRKLDKIVQGFARMEEALHKKEERLEEIIEDKVTKYLSEQKERASREQNVIFTMFQSLEAQRLKKERVMTRSRYRILSASWKLRTLRYGRR